MNQHQSRTSVNAILSVSLAVASLPGLGCLMPETANSYQSNSKIKIATEQDTLDMLNNELKKEVEEINKIMKNEESFSKNQSLKDFTEKGWKDIRTYLAKFYTYQAEEKSIHKLTQETKKMITSLQEFKKLLNHIRTISREMPGFQVPQTDLPKQKDPEKNNQKKEEDKPLKKRDNSGSSVIMVA